jgi:hypothetical protein
MKQFSVFFVAAALLFSSCGKDKTKTELLTGKWKVTDLTVAGVNTFASVPACQKDDFVTFSASGTVTSDEGATKCSASSPQTSTQTWSWSSNETILVVSNDSYTLTSLTATTLVLTTASSNGTRVTTLTKI